MVRVVAVAVDAAFITTVGVAEVVCPRAGGAGLVFVLFRPIGDGDRVCM